MRTIDFETVAAALAQAVDRALKEVDPDVVRLLKQAAGSETGAAKWALDQIVENDRFAAETGCYACQDTGLAILFVDVGADAYIPDLYAALNEGVRRGYKNARKSVADPLTRLNTGDNTPAVIHMRQTADDKLTIHYLAKGAGSENMSGVYMLTPSAGRQGIIDSVTDRVVQAGANPCPPIILGVGIGGSMETAALLSKRALLRPAGAPHPDPDTAALERDILQSVNATGIGAQGFGGRTTALYAAVETCPTHIGMLPVAVTVQCHSARHATVIL